MEHLLHLAAGHFISVIRPMAATEIIKKVKGAIRKGDNDDEDAKFNVADTLGKALALVKQVTAFIVSLRRSLIHGN
jgi:hypothetical protein